MKVAGSMSFAAAARGTHWTNAPYRWHINDGEEVFAVVDDVVDVHHRDKAIEHVVTLGTGDISHAGAGCEHVAHPRGEARILVIEHAGST